MGRLIVATSNPGKLREFAAALEPAGIEVSGLEALVGGPGPPPPETGATFEENARIKAECYSRRTPLAVLADDSGLEVDALGGEPGVRSARYGGSGLDDEARYRRLLEGLEGVSAPRRSARFRCVLAVARDGTTLATFEGTAEGRVLDEPRGAGGFGYDPVFFHEEAGRTFAELSRAEKARFSHRGLAIRRLIEALDRGELSVD